MTDHGSNGPLHLSYVDTWEKGVSEVFVAAEETGFGVNTDGMLESNSTHDPDVDLGLSEQWQSYWHGNGKASLTSISKRRTLHQAPRTVSAVGDFIFGIALSQRRSSDYLALILPRWWF